MDKLIETYINNELQANKALCNVEISTRNSKGNIKSFDNVVCEVIQLFVKIGLNKPNEIILEYLCEAMVGVRYKYKLYILIYETVVLAKELINERKMQMFRVSNNPNTGIRQYMAVTPSEILENEIKQIQDEFEQRIIFDSYATITSDLSKLMLTNWTGDNRMKNITKEIKRVVFNEPATIVFWNDNTKTVTKCQPNDTYDKEKGLAMCIIKKICDNKGNFNNIFKKWCE